MTHSSLNIIIAGGKTGGHLFPGIAVASALKAATDNVNCLFVGTNAPFETRTLKQYGFAHKAILAQPIKGGSIVKKAYAICMILVSLIQSLTILVRFKPGFVLGVGGFSSFAVVLAAWIMRIPTGIQEQNAIPGMTNRLLARFTDTIFTSFEATRGWEDNPKTTFTGTPVRRTDDSGPKGLEDLDNFRHDRFTILVTGGSQGASSINNAFVDALARLDDPERCNIIHQTGKTDETRIKDAYQNLGINAEVKAFFNTMPQIQTAADLVIARAGAGTIAELSEKGKAVILIPFPHAADDHQTYNAKALEDKGAAIMIQDGQLNGSRLFDVMDALINDNQRRKRMAAALKSLAMPDADMKIATHILNIKGAKA